MFYSCVSTAIVLLSSRQCTVHEVDDLLSFLRLWYLPATVLARDIIIIGSGPAGASTALHLLKAAPSLADEILLLDKATHPREKICAGGLIPHTLDCLKEMDIPLSVPH